MIDKINLKESFNFTCKYSDIYAVTSLYFINYHSNKLFIYCRQSDELLYTHYNKDVKNILIYKDEYLLVFTNDIEIYKINNNHLKEVDFTHLNKSEIMSVTICNNYVIIGQSDNNVFVFRIDEETESLKVIEGEIKCSGRLKLRKILKHKNDFLPENVFMFEETVWGVYNQEMVYYKENCYEFDDIKGVLYEKNDILILTENKLCKLDGEIYFETNEDVVGSFMVDDEIYLYNSNKIFYNKSISISDYNSTHNDVGVKRNRLSKYIEIENIKVNKDIIILTDDYDLILLDEDFNLKNIYSFNENITGLVKDEHIFIGTSGGNLKKIRNVDGCKNSLLTSVESIEKVGNSIVGLKIVDGRKIAATMDGNVFDCEEGLKNIFRGEIGQKWTAFDADSSFFMAGTACGNLFIFKENVMIFSKKYNRQISAVRIANNHFIVLSYDSVADFIDKNKFEIFSCKIDKPLCVDFNEKWMVIAGYKKIKIFNTNLDCVMTYSVARPVINVFIYKTTQDDYFVAITDHLRVYNKSNFLFATDLNIQMGWLQCNNKYIAGENKISIIDFYKTTHYTEKEIDDKKVNMLINNDLISYFRLESDKAKQFKVLHKKFDEEMKEELNKVDVGEILVNNGQFKETELFNKVFEECRIDRKHFSKVSNILKKQKERIKKTLKLLNK